ncbi:cupin domain-containing protein [Carboxylicivirga sp. A043]|uniref:cupin domain-containing protein n=1 Tax=Carboxylicivirga litoralis TaxID=2816963 RepID=UPI0021CB0715|nr:cupin domain-containing protein [Carboxylicivirga sp. A043]MCU4154492.1 cupin domain-containing protein [Carboxylicivirga sp. A043]
MNKIDTIIKKLDLSPHPEGGYFKETYRSVGEIKADSLSSDYKGSRSYSTCIYFLLTSNNFSAFHRIKQDEIWHFYDGSPLLLHIITPEGLYIKHRIGWDIINGEIPQFVVPGGCWFGAEVVADEAYSLVGCTVSPGFSFDDFELKPRNELIELFPHLEKEISHLTHD